MEFQEDPIACAKRETLEEANITLKNCQVIGFTDDHFAEKHYITLLVLADYDQGRVTNREPESCEKLERMPREDIPAHQPLFLSMDNIYMLNPDFHPFDNVIPILPL